MDAEAPLLGDGLLDRLKLARIHDRDVLESGAYWPRLVPSDTAATAPTQRDRHLQCIAEHGRRGW